MEDIILPVLIGIAILIGIWGIACLIGGMVYSGGPLKLIKNWVKSLGSKEK